MSTLSGCLIRAGRVRVDPAAAQDADAADELGQGLQQIAMGALPAFNDAITRTALAQGVPVLDLRLICAEEADFANPIEPSAQGGAKMARAIERVLRADIGAAVPFYA